MEVTGDVTSGEASHTFANVLPVGITLSVPQRRSGSRCVRIVCCQVAQNTLLVLQLLLLQHTPPAHAAGRRARCCVGASGAVRREPLAVALRLEESLERACTAEARAVGCSL